MVKSQQWSLRQFLVIADTWVLTSERKQADWEFPTVRDRSETRPDGKSANLWP